MTSKSLLLGDLLALAEATRPRWWACSLFGRVWTGGGWCSHICSSILLTVLGRPKPSAASMRYTFWSPWHWMMRYILSLNVSCILFLPAGWFCRDTLMPTSSDAPLAFLSKIFLHLSAACPYLLETVLYTSCSRCWCRVIQESLPPWASPLLRAFGNIRSTESLGCLPNIT